MLTDSGGYQIFSLHYGGVSDEIKGRRRNGVKSRRRDSEHQQKKTRRLPQHQRPDTGRKMRRIDCGVRTIDCREMSTAETATDAAGSLKSPTRRSESECAAEKEKDIDFLVSGENPLSRENSGLPPSSDDRQRGVSSVKNRMHRDGNSQEKGDDTVIDEKIEERLLTRGDTVGEEEDPDASSLLLGLNEDGATFRSYHTGEVIQLTPEMAMKTQRQLGKLKGIDIHTYIHIPACIHIHTYIEKNGFLLSLKRSDFLCFLSSRVSHHMHTSRHIGTYESTQTHTFIYLPSYACVYTDRYIHMYGYACSRTLTYAPSSSRLFSKQAGALFANTRQEDFSWHRSILHSSFQA